MTSRGHDADREARLARRLGDLAPFVMFIVDENGTITWTSGAVERLFGVSSEKARGSNILDHVDVGWSAEAIDSVAYAMTASGMQRPMLFRLNRADGSQVIAEITANAQFDDPDVRGLAVYARPWDEHWLLDKTLDAIAGNAPLGEVLDLLVGVMGAETLAGDGIVFYPDAVTGAQHTRAAATLGPHQRGDVPLDGNVPWEAARSTGEPRWAPCADLPDALAAEAAERGHLWCWAWPITAPNGHAVDGCLVLWRRDDEEPDHTCRNALDRLVRLSALLFEREAAAARLRHAAHHDALTGLANRATFFEQLQEQLDRSGRTGLVGVLYVDLDGFKPINDSLGHGVGDVLLTQVATRLRTTVGVYDLVARIGGDEFTILCPRVRDVAALEMLAERLLVTLRAPVTIGDREVTVGASIGIAAAQPGSCSIDVLVDAADRALYEVKGSQKGGWCIGTPDQAAAGGPATPST